MGYRIRFDNGHEVEFESKPTDADIDEAYKHTSSLPQPKAGSDFLSGALQGTKEFMGEVGKTFLNSKGIGLNNPSATAETATSIGTGMAGLGVGSVVGPLTPREGETAEKRISDVASQFTYVPKTEKGIEGTEAAGEFINRNLVPLAPIFGELGGAASAIRERAIRKQLETPKPKEPKIIRRDVAGAVEELNQETPPPVAPETPPVMPVTPEGQGVAGPNDMMFKQRAEEMAQQAQAAVPEPENIVTPGDPFAQMKQQLGTPQRVPNNSPVIDSMTKSLAPDLVTPKPEPVNPEPFALAPAEGKVGEAKSTVPASVEDFQSAVREKVETDPRVLEATARMKESQEAYIKGAMDLQEGKISESHFEKLGKDMDNMAEALSFLRNAAEAEHSMKLRQERDQALTQRNSAARNQAGMVDTTPLRRMVDDAIEKLKAYDVPVVRSAIEKYSITEDPKAFADARRDAKTGGAPPDVLQSLDNAYMAATKRKLGGIENSLGPRPIGPGKKQGGWILMDGNKKKAMQNLASALDMETKLRELKPSQWSLAEAIDHIKKAQDLDQNALQNMMNYFTKGGQYLALKTHNPLIRFVVERFLEADRRAKADAVDWIYNKDTGLAAAMRKLKNDEAADAWAVVDAGDKNQKNPDLVSLAQKGFTQAQLKFIDMHRKAMDYALQMINKARDAAGLDPITPRVAYAAMQATGDFRSLVYDKKGGNITGIISSNFRPVLNKKAEALKAQGYHVEEPRYMGGGPRERGSANDAFMRAIEMLSQNDPRMAQFLDVLDNLRTTEINNFLNMKRHTMPKKGITGMEGRKTDVSAYQNAVDGFTSQLNYLEAAIKWGHLAEAFADFKNVMKEAEHMPKAKQWAERYAYNALGFNPSKTGRAIEQAVASAFEASGVGFSVARHAMAKTRYLTNSLLLLARPSFWYQNIVQPLMAMPGMKADLIARGLDSGFDFGTGYMYVLQGTNSAIRVNANVANLTPFEKALSVYAKKNHVYGTDLVEHSNRPRANMGYYADQVNNFFAGNIESATRRLMFYAFAHMLKENGMPVEKGLFETAHNLTDISMNNYSALERPQIYNNLGPVGDIAVNLQSYKHNELSRVSMFIRDGMEYKSLRPILADTLTRFAFGGVLGLIGYNTVDNIFHFVSKKMGHPMSLTNIVFKASEGLNRMVYDKTGGKIDQPYLLSNGIHSMIGLDLSRSLGLTDVVPENLTDLVFPGGSKLAEAGKAAYNFTGLPGSDPSGGPTVMNAKRAIYAAVPLVAQGPLSNEWFTQGEGNDRLALRPRDLSAQAHRNDFDYKAKALGFTGINESVERQKTYNIERMSRDYADLRQKPLDHMRDSLFAEHKLDPADVRDYVKYRGNPNTLAGDLERYTEQSHLTPQEIAYLHASASTAIGRLMKAQDYLEMFSK
jgi:hypothetical protein